MKSVDIHAMVTVYAFGTHDNAICGHILVDYPS